MSVLMKPRVILLELTNRCNGRCPYCRHNHIKKFYDMDFDFYKRIVDETEGYGKVIHPNGCGEPLLYPQIVEAIDYANKKRRKTKFYTNASMLDRNMSEKLLEVGLNEIRFSVDGCDKSTFEPLRVGLSWNKVLSNIEYFLKHMKQGGYKCTTMIRATLTKETRGRWSEIRDFWEKRGVDSIVPVKEFHIPTPSEFLKPKYSSSLNPFKCKRPIQHLTVTANGKLALCCVDYLGAYVLGDLNKTSVLEAFNSETFNQVRTAMKKGKNYPSLCNFCRPKQPSRRK